MYDRLWMGSAYYLQERGNKEGLLSLGEQGGYDKEGYFLDMRRSCFYFLFSVAA